MKKYCFILVLILFLTGCSGKVTININKNTITEKLEVSKLDNNTYNQLKTWSGFPIPLYYDQELDKPLWLPNREKESGVSYYDVTFNDETKHANISGSFTLNSHERSTAVRRCFKYYDIKKEGEVVSFATGHGLVCAFTNFDVIITTPYKVVNHNANSFDTTNNTYVWNITDANAQKAYIYLEVDFSQNSNGEKIKDPINDNNDNIEKHNYKYIYYTILLILLLLVLGSIYIFNKKKTVSKI